MTIDIEWKMGMEKVVRGRESENRQRGRVVKCSERWMREEAGSPSSHH